MNHNRKIIYLAGFFFSLPIALTSYINSSFLSSLVDEKLVGIIYVLASISSIIALLIAPKIFRKIGAYKFLLFIILINILSLLILASAKNAWSTVLVFILYFTVNTLIIFSLDELLKIFSKDSATGKIRGTYLVICNSAWVIAQLAFGIILGKFNFAIIYLFGSVIMLLFLLISFLSLKNIPEPKYDRIPALQSIKKFIKNRNLFRAHKMSFLLQFFYAWMVIYTPIYLSAHLGFTWKEIGLIFTIMLLPFILIQWPLGKYSDKVGERKMLMLGFFITFGATLSLFFINGNELWIWALALFITRIGAAIIEVMSDVYFFKHIRPENEEFVGIYRNASPIAYIVAPLLASVIFVFLPSFNFIYIILSVLMLFGIYLASTIRKNDI